MIGLQAYSQAVQDSWMRYNEQCNEASWFTRDDVFTVPSYNRLKRQSVDDVFGDDINPPRAIAIMELKKPELFVPWVIVSNAGKLFEGEVKREVLNETPYYLRGLTLKYNNSDNGSDYFVMSSGAFRKDTISNGEREKLVDFCEDCIDLAILFANPEFRQVCEELSQFPKQVAERYVRDLKLRGGQKQ